MEEASKKIHRMGSRHYAVDSADLKSMPSLPPAIYTLGVDTSGQIFASQTKDFSLPPKLYGEIPGRCDRILNTYEKRVNKNTGVVLFGDKGSGKTLLGKQIMIKGIQKGIPSILVTNNIDTNRIIWFINSLNGPKIVMFDEFEKNYRTSSAQEEWLSLFDGTGNTNTMFLLTTNNPELSSYLDNRPGRIFYKIEYKGLAADVIKAFVDDNIAENLREHGEKIKNLATMFNEKFNFDMLAAWIEEVNRYGESPLEALRYLNISQFFDKIDVTMKIMADGKELDDDLVSYDNEFDFTELSNPTSAEMLCVRKALDSKSAEDPDYSDWENHYFNKCQIVKADYVNQHFILDSASEIYGKIRIEIKKNQVEIRNPWERFFNQLSV